MKLFWKIWIAFMLIIFLVFLIDYSFFEGKKIAEFRKNNSLLRINSTFVNTSQEIGDFNLSGLHQTGMGKE